MTIHRSATIFIAVLAASIITVLAAEEPKPSKAQSSFSDRDVAKAMKTFFLANFGDTDTRITANQEEFLNGLSKKFRGQTIKFVFPIKNVSLYPDRGQGVYQLELGPWKFCDTYSPPLAQCVGLVRVYAKLTKEQSLSIGTESLLEVSGIVGFTRLANDNRAGLLEYNFLRGMNEKCEVINWKLLQQQSVTVQLTINEISARIVSHDEEILLHEKKDTIKGVEANLEKQKTKKENKQAEESSSIMTVQDIAKEVKTFLAANLGDTDVKIVDNHKKLFEELAHKINGHKIKMKYPIRNVTLVETGKYCLNIDPRDRTQTYCEQFILLVMSSLNRNKVGN